jgi:hypothetical protein
MTSRSSRILIFAVAFSVFIIVPAFLSQPFPPYPLMHVADVFDLLTPFVLMVIYWQLFHDGETAPDRRQTFAFVILGTLWVAGQAMHLAANSINNLLGQGTTGLHDLVHFYDEVLSHYLWHLGILGLSVLLLVREAGRTAEAAERKWTLLASVVYGLTFFLAVNEGGTVPLGLPACAVIVLGLWRYRRGALRRRPLADFFLTGYLLALLLLLGWGIYWGGFPEFTEVGLL